MRQRATHSPVDWLLFTKDARRLLATIVYESATHLQRASELYEQLASQSGTEHCEAVSWSFPSLFDSGRLTHAVRSASESNIVILAGRDAAPLPPAVEQWFGHWLGKARSPSVFVSLLDKQRVMSPNRASLLPQLQQAARACGIIVIPERQIRGHAGKTGSRPWRIPADPHPSQSATADVTLSSEWNTNWSVEAYDQWGIND